jgi:hypothetical protein
MRVRGETVFDKRLAVGWAEHAFTVPHRLLSVGLVYVQVEQEQPRHPWPIGATGVSLPYEVAAESAGYPAGNRAAIHIDGEATEARDRGVTLFTFDRQRPRARKVGSYDTFRSPEDTSRFVRDVAALPPGTVTAVVVKDEASIRWSPAADEALKSLGAATSLMGRYRASYAMIGLKGARSGQAVEQLSAGTPANVSVGRSAPEQRGGIAWGQVVLFQ